MLGISVLKNKKSQQSITALYNAELVHIPEAFGHPFRKHSDSRSGKIRTLI